MNSLLLILFAVLASVTFMSIVFFLAMLAGNIGLFIGVALLVMQLSTTGSALPIDMLPEYLRNLSNFLPMTYSLAGFRSLISLDDFGMMIANGTMLVVFLVLFAGLSVGLSFIKKDYSAEDADIAA